MHCFKPETNGDLVESSDDVEALNTDDPQMESLDDSDDSFTHEACVVSNIGCCIRLNLNL